MSEQKFEEIVNNQKELGEFFDWLVENYKEDLKELIRDNYELESWLDTFHDVCAVCHKKIEENKNGNK